MQPILLEAGPATIRVLDAPPGAEAAGARAALDALDEPVALLDGAAVPVDDLLRDAVAQALNCPGGPVTVVHPSWWPRTRVDRVVAAVGATAVVAAAIPRCAILRRRYGAHAVVVEIAGDTVAISGPAGLRLLDGGDTDGVAAGVADGAPVLIDAPDGLPGAPQRAAAIRKALSSRGIRAPIVAVVPLTAPRCDREPDARASRRWIPVSLVAVAAAVIAGVGLHPDPPRVAAPVTLAEGRAAVEIPPRWTVRRVTDGPGSRRVEVRSPDDAAALHITSSYAPDTTLAEAAAVLRRAMADAPAGVFVDVRPTGRFAGRPALGYREIRPGRVISWWLVLDHSTRIAIGCQSPAGREGSVRAACLAAVASARERIPGTETPGNN